MLCSKRDRAFLCNHISFAWGDRIETIQVSLYMSAKHMNMALIDDFRKQTKETILDYMDGLGVNHTVYSFERL